MKLRIQRNMWKISASERVTDKPAFWEEFRDNNIIAFGTYGEGDIQHYDNVSDLEKKISELKNTKHSSPTANFCFEFRDEVESGDIVIVYARKTIFGIGYVISGYYYKEDELGKGKGEKEEFGYKDGIPNRRDVKWIVTNSIKDEKLAILSKPQITFFKLNKEQEKTVIKVLKKQQILDRD